MDKLKPCPFCGNEEVGICYDSWDEEYYGVKCLICGGSIYPDKETEEEAIEAWNKRAETLEERAEMNIYDKETRIENCTVQILTNSITGETSIGWWEND